MERDRIRAVTDFSRNVAVDASAGTGKTATLIARAANLFLARRDLAPDEVLMLTFTEKAAAEMKARLVEGWERLLSACDAGRPDGTPVETAAEAVESLRAWNPLLRLPEGPPYTLEELRARAREMVEGAGRLSATTFHAFCKRLLSSFPAEAGVDPRFEVLPRADSSAAWDAAFRRFLQAEFGGAGADPRWELVLSQGAGREAVFGMIRRLCLSQRDVLLEGPLDFGTPADFLEHLRAEYAGAVEWFVSFVGMIADPRREEAGVLAELRDLLLRAWEAVTRGDLEAARALAPAGRAAFSFDARRFASRKAFPRPEGTLTPGTAREALREFFRALSAVPPGDEAARFLVERARAALALYDEAKGSGLDFMDLLLRATRLLSARPDVAARLAARFRYVFVDEFQDTDPLQARMLAVLSSQGPPGRLFLVGDPKQSIYGFRRADIQVYHRFREEVVAAGGESVALVRNFRSRPGLVDCFNGLFARVLRAAEDYAPPYLPVEAHRTDRGEGPAATLYALDEPVGEAGFLAALLGRIRGTVLVRDRGDAPERQCSWKDIVVLYRADTGGTAQAGYTKALDAAGIPYVVSARRGFYLRQEVQDLRIVLSAVDAPADASARHAALKTIFFGLSDEEILALSAGGGTARARDAAALLERLRARRGRTSLSDLVAELFRESGIDFVAARLPEGERIAQNLARAADLAREFEREAGGSLKAFLAELRRRTKDGGEEEEFPAFDEGEDAVRISTIHAAKGLEFPVVVLCNLSRGGRKAPEGLRVDRRRGLAAVMFPGFRTYSAFRRVPAAGGAVPFEEWERRKMEAEERRLLYVAATRARDRLFMVAGARGAGSALLDALHEGLGGASDGGEERCPVTGLAGVRRVLPGGGVIHEVAVREPLPVPSPAPSPVEAAAEVEPMSPEAEPPFDAPPAAVPAAEFVDRERGKRFGEKVHRLLEAAPPVGAAWPPRGFRAGAVVSLSDGERARWKAIVGSMANSRFREALAGAALVGTEFPLLSCRGGRAELDRADLVVRVPRDGGTNRDAAEYWIVDYKTGRREADAEEGYVRQVRGYMEILRAAWGVAVRGFVWYVESGEAVEVG